MNQNAERNAEIVRLRVQGLTWGQIAKEMNLTRNAVIGVLRRDAEREVEKRDRVAGPAKLTADEAREIRRRVAAGETVLALASEYRVRSTTLYNITSGRSWKACA